MGQCLGQTCKDKEDIFTEPTRLAGKTNKQNKQTKQPKEAHSNYKVTSKVQEAA